jgi:homopolymeric O-antigen transport system ATP-binding protein
MTDIALRAEGLGKEYRINWEQKGYKTFRDTLARILMAPIRRTVQLTRGLPPERPSRSETIWALQDVSFEIGQGEIVGVIGRNGAGKSTLLKILSRITEPTTGFADIHGRVGSLLEVGTGFHGELTGRENIYLNGAILGMRKAEITRKFDEIVDFAEVDKFVDTPVKHYSTGMYLRLAFAVAAYLESEILIVDEVLAVGDVNFQRKCLNKMQDINQQGRTVLLVSHNMSAITRLCARALLIDQGKIIQDGAPNAVVNGYLSSGLATPAVREWLDLTKAPSGKIARLCAVRVRTEDGQISESVDIRRPLTIEMEYEVLKPGYVLLPYYQFHTQEGVIAFETNDLDPAWRGRPRPAGRWVSVTSIPGNLLAEGVFSVSPGLITMDPALKQFYEREAVAFQVIDKQEGDSARGDWTGPFHGCVRPLLRWHTLFNPTQSSTVD